MGASKNLLPIAAVALCFGIAASCCRAQELRRYQPSRPTVSPYLNLARLNDGALPNYYSLVRPLNRQRQINFQTQRVQRQQTASLRQLQQTTVQGRLEAPTTGTRSQFLTPGTGAVYRETLQFYPPVNLRQRR